MRQPGSRRRDGWTAWLLLWTALGLGVRIAAVLGRPHRRAGGDAYYYHYAANLLVGGHGFINPFLYLGQHRVVATAAFPPGFVFVLAAAAVVGFKSYFAQRIWCAVIGAAAVAACGLAGREIAGRRAGLIAAALAAVYPNLWMSDEVAMSETITPLVVALVLLAAYRFAREPSVRRAAWLGAAVGVTALCRDELALLGLLVAAPVVLRARGLPAGRRLGRLAVAAGCAVVIVGPWVGWNLTRFSKPVFISTGLGPTLASTNCPSLYSGPFEGYWSRSCAAAAPVDPRADESVQSAEQQSWALHQIRAHLGRQVPVEAARLGRGFGLFHPLQQIDLDATIELRPRHWAEAGLAMYYALSVLAAGGVYLLRRRGVAVWPLFGVGLAVVVAMTLSFGDTRYRTPWEVCLLVLASVPLDRVIRRRRGSREAARDSEPAGQLATTG